MTYTPLIYTRRLYMGFFLYRSAVPVTNVWNAARGPRLLGEKVSVLLSVIALFGSCSLRISSVSESEYYSLVYSCPKDNTVPYSRQALYFVSKINNNPQCSILVGRRDVIYLREGTPNGRAHKGSRSSRQVASSVPRITENPRISQNPGLTDPLGGRERRTQLTRKPGSSPCSLAQSCQ